MLKQTFTLLFLITTLTASAQNALFQGWYWNYPTSMPNPVPGQPTQKWVSHINSKMAELNDIGVKYVWVPPLSRGTGNTSMGYDIFDYFDVGQYTNTRWGLRSQLTTLIQNANGYNMDIVGDLVYNHRDGGKWEDNPAVKGWVLNYTSAKVNQGDAPYPSDRMRSFIKIGAGTPHGAGEYYIKIKSQSNHPNFTNKTYQFITYTNRRPANPTGVTQETEPNGGGDCGQANMAVPFGTRIYAKIDDPAGGCNIDEFHVTIDSTMFKASGDTLWFALGNVSTAGGTFGGANLGDMSDHVVYGIWHHRTGDAAGHAIAQGDFGYQTATDFSNVRSGRGQMNRLDFRPNGGPTCLCGDPDGMLFFYDLDQNRQQTRDTLFAYSRYMFQNVGIKGMRVDAVKHFPQSFMGDLLDNLYQNNVVPSMVVAESYDYSATVLRDWVSGVDANMDAATKQNVKVRIFDFALREQMRQACDAFGYDVRWLYTNGCVDNAGMSGYNVVTFVENHDFREVSQKINNNRELAYAYILTNIRLGLPTIYYPDYYGVGNIRGKIKGLMKAHQRYIKGATMVDYLNKIGQTYPQSFNGGYANTTLVYQIRGGQGASDVVSAINFAGERMRLTQQINDATIQPGDTLTDIFSVSGIPYTIVNAQRQINIELPARSFGLWVKGDKRNQLINLGDTLFVATENIGDFNEMEKYNTLNVFPNPFENNLSFSMNATQGGKGLMSLFNVVGQTLWTQNININQGEQIYELNDIPQNLPKGVYFLTLQLDGKLYRQKVVKS